MALRIGKKNNADDWSDESLRQELAQISEQPGEAMPASSQGAADDPLAGLLDDTDNTVVTTPTPAVQPPAYDATTAATTPDAPGAAPRRPKISPVLLAAGLVFLIVAGGVGAYLTLFSAPAEDDTVPTVVAQRPPSAPTSPGAPPPATRVVQTPGRPVANRTVTATPVPKSKVVPPKVPVRRVTPGKAGIAPKNGTAPAIAPKAPGQAPSVVPVKGVPTPVGPPPGMAGQPGKGSSRTTTVQIVRPVAALTPAVAQQLKALWNQGAAAKHRGDNAGARRAWEQILRIRPGHPGIQDAIDKLPK